jgi:multidrug efflux pump subunit AcrA (membrane-fusion protein)
MVTLPDGGTVRGTVRQVSPTLDPQSRIALAYVDLEPGPVARAGMYLPGRLQLGEGRSLAVPAASVVMRDGRTLVFTVEQAPGGNARLQRRVETDGASAPRSKSRRHRRRCIAGRRRRRLPERRRPRARRCARRLSANGTATMNIATW